LCISNLDGRGDGSLNGGKIGKGVRRKREKGNKGETVKEKGRGKI
jgi:hypothetical protein